MLTRLIGIDSQIRRVNRGAGVDLHPFKAKPSDSKFPPVNLVRGILWDNGVGDFVESKSRQKRRLGYSDHTSGLEKPFQRG